MATKVRGIDATYYLVKDMDRAAKFYTALLGAEPTARFNDFATEWTFPGGEAFGLYKPHEGGEFQPSGGVMFAVADITSAIADYKGQGVKFDDDGKVEETPVCFMAFGSVSEGNTFILHQAK